VWTVGASIYPNGHAIKWFYRLFRPTLIPLEPLYGTTSMTVSEESIRVLHVDDEPDLADMVATFLETADDRLSVTTAKSATEGLDRLSTEAFDCVVSDHDMPGQNGIEFLEAVRASDPDLPFILYTGKGSEEVASDAISAGVTDYLQKEHGTDHYAVLANRVSNAVASDRAERRAERTRAQLAAIVENTTDAILIIDEESTITFANSAVETLLGYDADSLEGEPIGTLMADRYRGDHLAAVARYLETGERTINWQSSEFECQHRDGREIPVSVSFSEFDQDGETRFIGVVRDISDRIRMETELREREERFRQLAENLSEVVWMSDPSKSAMLYVNPAYEDVWGRTVESLYTDPRSFLDAIHPDDRDRVEAALESQPTGQYAEEYRVQRPDGSERWVYDCATPVRDADGDVTRIVGIASDVTERKERERELELVGDLLQETERIADVGGWEIDTETQEVFWTDHLFEVLGVESEEEPPLEEALDVYHEDDRHVVESAVGEALETGEPFDVEVRFRRQTSATDADDGVDDHSGDDGVDHDGGDVRWLRVQGTPTIEDGEVVTLRGAAQDVTDRRARERVLRDIHDVIADRNQSFTEQVRALLELGRRELGTEYGTLSAIRGDQYVFEVVAGGDDDVQAGNVVPVEATNCEIVAATEESLVLGDVARDAPAETDRAGFSEWGIACYVGAPVFVDDAIYGTFCFYDRSPREGFSEWEETLVDLMSRWVSAELQRRQSNERLQRRNDQLEQFASIVSHDLRNPLNVAAGAIDLAAETGDLDELSRARGAMDRMDTLIEDLLTLAREGGQGDREPIELGTLVEGCWRTVETGDATLVADVDMTVRAEESRLKQLFENLFRNAVEHGGSAVTVTVGELPGGFFVEDDGTGIPEADRDAVFESGHSTTPAGTGFGLSIAREVATAHDWDIAVTGGSDGGARFEVTGVAVLE
jgi:PAS domain S-box-containing protein